MSRACVQNAANLMTAPSGTTFLFENAPAISWTGWIYLRSKTNSSTANYLFSLPTTTSGQIGFDANINGTGGRTALRIQGKPNTTDTQSILIHSADMALNTWTALGGACDFANKVLYAVTSGSLQSATVTGWATGNVFNGVNSGDTVRIGCHARPSPIATDCINADLAHFAFWNTLLSANEFSAIASGTNPFNVRNTSLVLYFPLLGFNSPEPEFINNEQLTITGTINPGASEPPFNQMFVQHGATLEILAGAVGIAPIASQLMSKRKAA